MWTKLRFFKAKLNGYCCYNMCWPFYLARSTKRWSIWWWRIWEPDHRARADLWWQRRRGRERREPKWWRRCWWSWCKDSRTGGCIRRRIRNNPSIRMVKSGWILVWKSWIDNLIYIGYIPPITVNVEALWLQDNSHKSHARLDGAELKSCLFTKTKKFDRILATW